MTSQVASHIAGERLVVSMKSFAAFIVPPTQSYLHRQSTSQGGDQSGFRKQGAHSFARKLVM
jgi:hypothetical protein